MILMIDICCTGLYTCIRILCRKSQGDREGRPYPTRISGRPGNSTQEDLMGETSFHAEAEAQRADAAIRQAQVSAEKLRSLGIDPDQLL